MANEAEDLGDLADRDRRGRLVHEHDLRFGEPGAGDGDGLPLTARHLLDEIARPGFRFQFLEELPGAAEHRGVIKDGDRAEVAADLAAEKDVGGRRQVVAQRKVLIDDLDTVLARLDRPVQDKLGAVHPHRAMGRAKISGDDLDQRRLAGAVIAHESDDLTLIEVQRNVVKRVNCPKMLGDIGELKDRHSARPPPSQAACADGPSSRPLAGAGSPRQSRTMHLRISLAVARPSIGAE